MLKMKQLWLLFNEFEQQVQSLHNVTRIQAELCVLPGRKRVHEGPQVKVVYL